MEITFILVEPAREENIGAAARAMKTMGFTSMRLVKPGEYLGERALATAHASNEILHDALVFKSLSEAIANVDFVIGSTAKHRNVREDYHLAGDLPKILTDKGGSINTVAVVFGREESGLTNEELALCHLLTTIPMRSKYPSLNLGQAVMVYAYELSKVNFSYSKRVERPVTEGEFSIVRKRLSQILSDINLDSGIQTRVLERFSLLGKADISLFHRFVQSYFGSKK